VGGSAKYVSERRARAARGIGVGARSMSRSWSASADTVRRSWMTSASVKTYQPHVGRPQRLAGRKHRLAEGRSTSTRRE